MLRYCSSTFYKSTQWRLSSVSLRTNCKAVDPDVDDDEAAAEKADDTARESAEGNAFDIEDTIDVDNLDLRDTLSDKPISKPKLLPKEKQPTSVVAAAKELVESDWVL